MKDFLKPLFFFLSFFLFLKIVIKQAHSMSQDAVTLSFLDRIKNLTHYAIILASDTRWQSIKNMYICYMCICRCLHMYRCMCCNSLKGHQMVTHTRTESLALHGQNHCYGDENSLVKYDQSCKVLIEWRWRK